MFTQAELETLLTIGFVLVCLAASMDIYWILSSWKRERDHRVESYIKRLRALTEDDSYNKTYTNPDTEQITFNRKKARN